MMPIQNPSVISSSLIWANAPPIYRKRELFWAMLSRKQTNKIGLRIFYLDKKRNSAPILNRSRSSERQSHKYITRFYAFQNANK